MTMADVQEEMMKEAILNGGVPSDGTKTFENCWIFDHTTGIITLSYKNKKGSEHLVVRPLNREGIQIAMEAKEDAIKKGRIVLW